jgi:hypothetical protein
MEAMCMTPITAETTLKSGTANSEDAATAPAAFVTSDGCRFEVADGENVGRATALASEETLKRIWGKETEDEA